MAARQPEQAGRMGEEMAGVLSLQTSFLAVITCMCVAGVCVCSISLQLRRRVYLCALCACFPASACVRACTLLSVCHHKRRLSWQLAALLGSCCAKFRLLLSNIQTHPNLNHQPEKEPWPVLDASYPPYPPLKLQSPPQVSALCQDCHIALPLAQRVLGSLHSVS